MLSLDDGRLGYYHSEQEASSRAMALGVLDVRGCTVAPSGNELIFSVMTPERMLRLQAETASDAKRWKAALITMAGRSRQPVSPMSSQARAHVDCNDLA